MITRRDLLVGSLAAGATATIGWTLTSTADTAAAARDPLWVGACPRIPGGSGLTAAQTVINVWGTSGRVAIRQFNGGGLGTALQIPAAAKLIHYSWKPSSVAAITPTNVAATLDQAVETNKIIVVEVWHEIDKKVRDGVFSRNEGIARKNRFYQVVKDLYGNRVKVANTLTGWEADPDNDNTDGDIRPWLDVDADLLGMDFDGIRPTSNSYVGYFDELPSVHEFLTDARADLYSGWAIPEWGAPRYSGDPTGTFRAAWHNTCLNRYRTEGCSYVTAYEYDSTTGYAMTQPAEITGWAAQIANPTPVSGPYGGTDPEPTPTPTPTTPSPTC
jgi:hypothetical protein